MTGYPDEVFSGFHQSFEANANQLHEAESFSHTRNSQNFMKPEGSLPHEQTVSALEAQLHQLRN
jgi:hypothetical protein